MSDLLLSQNLVNTQHNINKIRSGELIYQGIWDAETNFPELSDGIGTQGFYYIVLPEGNTTVDGVTDWQQGQWIYFDSGAWKKEAIDSITTDSLLEGEENSFYTDEKVDDRVKDLIQDGSGITWAYDDTENTLTPEINLDPFTTDDLDEGGDNLYFLNSRAIGATLTGYTSGSGSISAADSILSAIQKLNGNIGLKADLDYVDGLFDIVADEISDINNSIEDIEESIEAIEIELTNVNTPYFVAENETYFIKENRQVLFGMTTKIDGYMKLDGYSVEV